jgi:hypothetical protein
MFGAVLLGLLNSWKWKALRSSETSGSDNTAVRRKILGGHRIVNLTALEILRMISYSSRNVCKGCLCADGEEMALSYV